jgi:hypothetical protein
MAEQENFFYKKIKIDYWVLSRLGQVSVHGLRSSFFLLLHFLNSSKANMIMHINFIGRQFSVKSSRNIHCLL